MVNKELTLNQLIERKARSYYDESREYVSGIPTKSLDECREEASEDYGTKELDQYNLWWKRHWNRIMDTPEQVIWADGKHDDPRNCNVCDSKCKYPVHGTASLGKGDSYKEIA